MPHNKVMITIPLEDLENKVGRIEIAEAGEDARGDLIVLKGEGFTIELTRNAVRPYYTDGPLPEEKMKPVIEGRNLVITFG